MSRYFSASVPPPARGSLPARAAFQARLALAGGIDRAMAPFIENSQTLIVSGFWRSGTTWLQHLFSDLLDAKVVFEPLHWYVREMQPVFAAHQAPPGLPVPNAFMPFMKAGRLDPASTLFKVIQKSCNASLASGWVRNRQNRPGLRAALRRRVVVKLVRGSLCLAAVRGSFSNPILHVTRDPRAVIGSGMYKTDRLWGNFEQFSLVRHLLEIEDGRRDYFSNWDVEIRSWDRRPLAIRMAAYWGLTEHYLREQMAGKDRKNFLAVRYEDLAANPDRAIPQLLKTVGLAIIRPQTEARYRQDSPSTRLPGQTMDQKIHGWRSLLSSVEREEIEEIAAGLGLEKYLCDPAEYAVK